MICLCKKIAKIWMMGIILFLCLPSMVFARDAIDQQRKVALHIHYEQEEIPVEGVAFQLYYVAEVFDYDTYVLSEEFQKYPVQLENLDSNQWRALAKTLTYYVQADHLLPIHQGMTNEKGIVTFPTGNRSLHPGLYLCDAKPKVHENYIYDTEPFLICLPSIDYDTDHWIYELSVYAKGSKEETQKNPSAETTKRAVWKIWKEDSEEIRPKEVVVELFRNETSFETVTLNAENNWRHTWTNLPVYDEQGAKNEWGIIEKEIKDYTASVSLEGTTFVLTNTYNPPEEVEDKVSWAVKKVWKDKGCEEERPKEVTVHLLNNGVEYDTRVLSEENGWNFTWEALPRLDAQGMEINWSIQEEPVEGYQSEVSKKGACFLLTNSIEKPTLPQTGVLWWPVPVCIAVGLLFLILGHLLKGKREDA